MMRSAPHRQKGQVAISRANTRPSSLAQLQRGVPVLASCPSTPCWRGVGVTAPRRLLCGAKQPPYRTRWTIGKGTKAASFSKSSTGERVIPVVPSDQGVVKVYTRSPLVSSARRSFDEDIQYRKGIGTDTTHCRVGTQGMTHSTRWAAVWAMRRPAHDGQNPRRLQLNGSSSSFWHVSQPSRRKPWVRMPHCK